MSPPSTEASAPGRHDAPGIDMPECAAFVRDVLRNTQVRAMLQRWQHVQLPDAWLVAGCLFQTVWNLRAGRPAENGIRDCDLFYFDPHDLSEAGEQAVQARISRLFADLPLPVEAKNQARVHLWYPQWFGKPCPPLTSARDGIDRFLVLETCVGIRPEAQGWDVYTPNGLAGMIEGRLSPNPLTPHPELFAAKAASYRERWPWLRVGS
jgi:hypothetical protein